MALHVLKTIPRHVDNIKTRFGCLKYFFQKSSLPTNFTLYKLSSKG